MALANRVYVSTISTGTGTVTPGAKVSNAFTSFATANAGAPLANGDYTYELNEGLDFEVGNGTWDGSTLTRNVVYISSIAGVIGTTKMTLAGSATIQVVAPAEAIANLLSNNTFTGLQAITPASQLAAGTSALTITATQPTTPVTVQNAVSINITGAGSAAQTNNAFFVSYLAGYTGSSLNRAGQFTNANLGTGSILIAAAGANTVTGNIGVNGAATGNTTGLNNGCIGIASNGDINVGVTGISQSVKNSAKNIGVVGSAINTGTSPVQIGGWFSLNQTTVPTVSAALIADNGSQTDPIARFRDAGTDVMVVYDGGFVGIGTYVTAPDSLLTLNANTGASVAPATTTLLHLVGADAGLNTITMDAYGSGSQAIISGRLANGTQAAKTEVTSASGILLNLVGYGWNTAAYSIGGAMQVIATGTWTTTSQPAALNFLTVNTGSTALTAAMRIQPSGGVSIGAAAIAADPGIGSLNMTGGITTGSTTLLTTSVALTNGAAAALGTLANAPVAGNPTKWVPINDNGTTRYIPAW